MRLRATSLVNRGEADGGGGGGFDPGTLSPLLWWDFSDESTVTASGGAIVSVEDKGSSARNLTPSATAPEYVVGINGLKCCDWGAAGHQNYLRNTAGGSISIAEIYCVIDANFGSIFPNYNGLFTAVSGAFHLVAAQDTNDQYLSGSAMNQSFINGSTSESTFDLLPSINDPCIVLVKRNTNDASTFTSGVQLGNDRGFNTLNRGWGGLVGEVLAFSSVLSAGDRSDLYEHLADKWGITLS